MVVESLDLEAGAKEGTAKSRAKRISEVWLDIYRSMGGRIGPNTDNMQDIIYRTPADPMACKSFRFLGVGKIVKK
jgi:hypothetical protein